MTLITYISILYIIITLIIWVGIRYDMGMTEAPTVAEVIMMIFWPISIIWFVVEEYILP